MNRWWSLALRVLLLCSSCVVPIHAAKWKGWFCDDMTPNLCDNLTVIKGTFITRKNLQVHYWRYRSPNLDKEKYPVIVINGGPGTPHNYDLPLRQLACREREVIFYDQMGTGESTLPPNTTVSHDYPFLLDVSYYAEEVSALIKALDLHKYHIVSDSWGTMIAMQYAINKRDSNLLSLSLNGPVPSASEYVTKAWDPVDGTIGTLPDYIKNRMHAIEQAGDFDSEEMQEIQMVVFHNFYMRTGILPDCAMKSFGGMNEEVSLGMWAAIDFFNITGTLQDFDLWPDIQNGALGDIPTLITSGKYDMVRPVTSNALYQALPLSERILFPDSGHASVFDATEELLNAVDAFLDRVEFAETDEQVVFVPKRPGEERKNVPGVVLQYLVAFMVVVVTFILGVVVGQSRGGRGRSQYSEIA